MHHYIDLAVNDSLETLQDALKMQGLVIRSGCVNGVCGVCRCRLVAGEITYGHRHPRGLEDDAQNQGYILPCIARALTSVTLAELRILD